MLQEEKKKKKLIFPKHVAIIMDGNSRWAKKNGKLCIFGHKAGIKSVKLAIKFAIIHQFNALTLYAFSSENWNRPAKEISNLFNLFLQTLNSEIKNLHEQNVRFRVIGDKSKFSIKLQKSMNFSEILTKNNNGLTLNVAANYGGRWDIIQGIKKIVTKIKIGNLHPDQINENEFCKLVCMNDLSPVDLVIRTGGEKRISNFLLWQIAYSELFFTDVLWPDFNQDIFKNAIYSFSKRNRRFGSRK